MFSTQEYYGGTYPEPDEEVEVVELDEWDLVDLYEEDRYE